MIARLLLALAETMTRLGAPLIERTNPILVKEVRQALRGRYFMIVFWLTLTAATVSGSIILMMQGTDPGDASGIVFFQFMFGCLSVAANVFVPFSAFLALGSEWDENTHDLLVLTNLRPGQIIMGKLLASGIQLLLFYAALGPFLAFSFLLQGVDLGVAGWALATTLLTSLALSALAIALSSITPLKFVRVFLLAFLTAGLTVTAGWLIAPWAMFLMEPGITQEPFFLSSMLGTYTALLALIAFSIAFAAARMAHPEENRSTALRVLTSVVVCAGIGWMIYGYAEVGYFEFLFAAVGFGSALVMFLGTLFATEPETLGRRVRLQVPRRPVVGLLLSPWFPGGGRGYVFLLGHLALILGAAYWTPILVSGGSTLTGAADWRTAILVLPIFVALWVGVPSLIFSSLAPQLHWRVAARFAVPVFGFAGVFLPMLLGFLIGAKDVFHGEHPGNPGWVIAQVFDDGGFLPLLGVGLLALLVVLLNGWRMGKGVLEMKAGARYRLEAEERNVDRRQRVRDAGGPGESDAVPGA